MVSELINKYVWLIRILTKAGASGLLLEEIQAGWKRRWGGNYARRSFNNHREAIEEIFGIPIQCNRSSRRYFINFSDEATDAWSDTAWMINTFTVNSLLQLSKERLSGRVSVEDVPSGQKHLTELMEAMLENRRIIIDYQKYMEAEPETLNVKPYALKEDTKRWYLVGFCMERNDMRIYSLDRIKRIEMTELTFKLPKGFNIDDLLSDSYGPFISKKVKPQTIIMECSKKQAKFMADLPLHNSQKIRFTRDGAIVRLRVLPNTQLIMDLCALGNRIRIVSPDEIREKVMEEHRKALEAYFPAESRH